MERNTDKSCESGVRDNGEQEEVNTVAERVGWCQNPEKTRGLHSADQ